MVSEKVIFTVGDEIRIKINPIVGDSTKLSFNPISATKEFEVWANGLILAAETAVGKYPIKAVQMIRSLITEYKRWTPNTSILDLLRE